MIRTLTLLNDGPGCNRQCTRPASRAWSIQPEEINEAAVKGAMAGTDFRAGRLHPSRQWWAVSRLSAAIRRERKPERRYAEVFAAGLGS